MGDTAPNPVPSYVASLVRYALSAAAGFLIGKGVLDAHTADALSGAALAVLPVLWGFIAKRNTHKALAAAIAAPAGRATP